jgi:hypothetical protein
MPGFMPGIHVFLCWFRVEGVNGRVKFTPGPAKGRTRLPGHDAVANGSGVTS